MDAFFQTNTLCCHLSRLAKDPRLTDVERELLHAAWRMASDASSRVLRRALDAEAKTNETANAAA